MGQRHRYTELMKVGFPWRRVLNRLPPAVAAALAFAVVIGVSLPLVIVLPPLKDPNQECAEQCKPRCGRLVPDKDYPMGRTGYRPKCECY